MPVTDQKRMLDAYHKLWGLKQPTNIRDYGDDEMVIPIIVVLPNTNIATGKKENNAYNPDTYAPTEDLMRIVRECIKKKL